MLPRPDKPGPGETLDDVLLGLWRELFHANVHLELEARLGTEALSDEVVRQRIAAIGQTEFDEIRYVLKQDHRLLPPYDDTTTYVEFASTFLELHYFDADALSRTFPGLIEPARIDTLICTDIDATRLLERTRPVGAPAASELEDIARRRRAVKPKQSRGSALATSIVGTIAADAAPALLASAKQAGEEGNVVRSMLIRATIFLSAGPQGAEAEAGFVADIETLSARLEKALACRIGGADHAGPAPPSAPAHGHGHGHGHGGAHGHGHGHGAGDEPAPGPAGWPALLRPLAEGAASRAAAPWNAEARLLYDLQKACVDSEREANTIDLVTWITSFGTIPLRRVLPAQREVRVLKHLRSASAWVPSIKLSDELRRRLETLTLMWVETAEHNLRATVRPRLRDALDEVKLHPSSTPEAVSRNRMVEEIVDQIATRGFFSLQQLRDAISRSELKLPDLRGPGELFLGDPLLRLNWLLSRSLDGVYRPGEIYLRALQKVSSLAFGTRPGRFVVLYAVLPLLLSYMLLEFFTHLAHAIAHAAKAEHPPHLLNEYSFPIAAIVFFALIHVPSFRAAVIRGFSMLGSLIKAIFVTIPRWIWHQPVVQAVVHSRPVELFRRILIKPLVLSSPLLLVPQLREQPLEIKLGIAAGGFVLFNVLLNTPQGSVLEETATDVFLLGLRNLQHRVIPGLFALVSDLFRSMLEQFERLLYVVDELLRFRKGDSKISVALKAVAGFIWFFATYLIRIYVNLLIEPQINPIKHFPVVTVSHKIILPMSGQLTQVYRAPFAPLGPVVANTIGGTTVLLTPGVFGFLAWEFKENWKLYTANRSAQLGPLIIGHHGETIAKFLRPGFHSGTVPKIYAKLRRATDAESASKRRAELHHVEEALRHFASRELEALLEASPRWTAGEVTVGSIEISSNRIRIGIDCASCGSTEWIAFEEQSGWVLGSVTARGWFDGLDAEHRALVEAALGGFFKQAGVDLVREQIARCLPEGATYDVCEEGLIVWLDAQSNTRLVYSLEQRGQLVPVVQGPALATAPANLDPKRLLFREQAIFWKDWVAFWEAPAAAGKTVFDGPPLLPDLVHSKG